MEEIWKDIEGYKGLYQVSNLGGVKSLSRVIIMKNQAKRTINEKILKPSYNGDNGYLFVVLCKNGKNTPTFIHRIVALSFKENTEHKPQVNHKNGKKDDNRLENLEWATPQENTIHAYSFGLTTKGSARYNSKLSEEEAKSIKYDLAHLSYNKISEIFGMSKANISKIRLGKIWKHI